MKKSIFLLVLVFFTRNLFAQSYETDFEKNPVGTPYERPIWQADGFNTDSWDQGLKDRTQVTNKEAVSGTKSLQITYPAGNHGTSYTGAQVDLEFDPADEKFLSYYFQFSENFSWGGTSQGGKIPGLAGGDNCSGGDACDGTNGFSARFMWRDGGQIKLYLYHMDKPATYGEYYDFIYPNGDFVYFTPGEWYHLAERVKINSNGSTYDGEVQVWVNGQEVLHLTGLRFTNNGDKVDNFCISTFHGGSGEQWNCQETCYTYMDDIKIGDTYEDVEFVECEGPKLPERTSLCGVSELNLDANVSATNATFTWLKNGELINGATSNTYTTNQVGEYVVIYDSLGCFMKDTITVASDLNPNLGADRYLCASSFETLNANDSGTGYSYVWKKDGTLIDGATEMTYNAHKAGAYEVTISASGCDDASSSVNVTSGLISVDDVSGTENDVVTVTVNDEGEHYDWYDVSEGGTVFATGKTYEATVDATDSYLYVQDASAFVGSVGKNNYSESKSYSHNDYNNRKMEFEVYESLTIEQITVYLHGDQDVTIRIVEDDQKTVVHEITHKGLKKGQAILDLGFDLTPGIYYMDAVGTTGYLRHSNEADTDISFPYTLDGKISIIGSNTGWINAKPYYLFFYDWEVSAGNTCARAAVKVTSTGGGIVPPTITQEIELKAGWNLISTNVVSDETSIETIFAGLDVDVIKDADGFWKVGQNVDLNSINSIISGKAYLVKMNSGGILSIQGNPVAPKIDQIKQGWQMVGCRFQTDTEISTLFDSAKTEVVKNFDGFYEPDGELNSITNLEPGKGYYVKGK